MLIHILDVVTVKLMFYLLAVENVAWCGKLLAFSLSETFSASILLLYTTKTILLARSFVNLPRFTESVETCLLKDLSSGALVAGNITNFVGSLDS